MKNILAAAALVLLGTTGASHAATVTVPFQYAINFADPAVAAENGIAQGGYYSGVAEYDDTLYQSGQLIAVSSLNLNFGNFNFTNADDNFGGALIGIGSTANLTALLFETALTLGGAAAGDYLLSFNGVQGVLTPSGDTADFKVTASVVPIPAALPLLLSGLGLFGLYGRRRAV